MGDCLQTHEICQLYENNSTQLRIASLPDDILTRKTPVVFLCITHKAVIYKITIVHLFNNQCHTTITLAK